LVDDGNLASMKETIAMASDTIKDSGNGTGNDTPTGYDNSASPFGAAAKAFGSTASSFTDQAAAKAREYTGQGKDRAVDALDNVATLVIDAAAAVDAKLGDQYGGYIRQAADAVSGLANTLREKDADELFDDARDAVRSSPAIAIAAAAAVGFLVARVVKSGLTPKEEPTSPEPEVAQAKPKTRARSPKDAPKA
jgi:ElaB/YqjD/DUF883 family membrane-anchored ribosome-binding protein